MIDAQSIQTLGASMMAMRMTASADLATSVLEGLAVLHPADGEMFEIRVLESGRVDAGYFSNVKLAAAAIEAHVAVSGTANYYTTLNIIDPARVNGHAIDRIQRSVKTATRDDAIARRSWLLGDIDPVRAGKTSSTDAELHQALLRRDAVVSWLSDVHGWPEPYLALSGNGGHAGYAIDLAVTPETDALVKSVLAALSLRFSDDSISVDTTVGNASRIVKVYGTIAHKGIPTLDRPHRRAAIEQVPDAFVPVTIEQLQAVAALAPVNGRHRTTAIPVVTSDRNLRLHRARAYLAKVPGAIDGQHGDQATFVAACRVARDFALDRADALMLLREWNSRCSPPWPDADLEAKIDRAMKYGNGPIGSKTHEDRPDWRGTSTTVTTPAADASGTTVTPLNIDLNRLTDAHAAELLAQRAGDHLRHDQQQGTWYSWRPPIWREDVTGVRQQAVVRLARDVAQYALTRDDLDVRKRVLKFALGLESRRGTDDVLKLAQHRPPIAVTSELWDRDIWLLNTPSGTIDLHSGEARPARPTDLCRHCTGATYDPEARAPRFDRFLQEVFAGDVTLITYLQRLAGYTLTGDVREQIFDLWHGLGANGKSVLLSTLGFVWGTYAHVAPFKAFAQQYGDGGDVPSPELAALQGKRLIAASETRDGTRLDEGRLKNLTGGEVITARYLFGKYFSFKPEGKIFLAANHRPKVTDDSLAFWRRCHVLPFGQSFTGAAADPTLGDQLRVEASGILNWALAGCLAWQRNGLNPPAAVLLASARYREANDALAGFLRDCTDPHADPDDTVLTRDAFAAYKRWCDREGLADRERLGVRTFGERLDDKGFTRFHSRGGVAHRTLKLVTL